MHKHAMHVHSHPLIHADMQSTSMHAYRISGACLANTLRCSVLQGTRIDPRAPAWHDGAREYIHKAVLIIGHLGTELHFGPVFFGAGLSVPGPSPEHG